MIPSYTHAIVKFNGGRGALLCNGCRIIVATGVNHADIEHYCPGCTHRNNLEAIAKLDAAAGGGLIQRALLAPTWFYAFTLACRNDPGVPTPALEFDPSAMGSASQIVWTTVRRICREYADRAGDKDVAVVWSMLGADPRDGRTYLPVLSGIARFIVADPGVLDDDLACDAVQGWRAIEAFGAGEDDLFTAVARSGGRAHIDRDEIMAWAQSCAAR